MTRLCRFSLTNRPSWPKSLIVYTSHTLGAIICSTSYAVASRLMHRQHLLSGAKKGYMIYEWCLALCQEWPPLPSLGSPSPGWAVIGNVGNCHRQA